MAKPVNRLLRFYLPGDVELDFPVVGYLKEGNRPKEATPYSLFAPSKEHWDFVIAWRARLDGGIPSSSGSKRSAVIVDTSGNRLYRLFGIFPKGTNSEDQTFSISVDKAIAFRGSEKSHDR